MRNKEHFAWGNPCRQGHSNAEGQNLRYKNICVMCERGAGRYVNMTQEQVLEYLTRPRQPKRTEEEIRKLRSAASMRWNAKNKDKTAEYAKKYANKPERKAYVNARNREQYIRKRIEMTPEQRAEREAINREKRLKREALRALRQTPEYIEAQKERRRQRQREDYAKMTQEQKEEMYAKRRAREQRKQDEHKRT